MDHHPEEITYDIGSLKGTQIFHPSAHLTTPENPIGQPCAQNVHKTGQPDWRDESEARM